jgi:hypothetical protein
MKEEIKHRRTQYKRGTYISGSPYMGYIHGEIAIPSFIPSRKIKG